MTGKRYKSIIVGAGAAGLYAAGSMNGCAPCEVLVVDHAKRAAEKVRISGGGRCNFTNLEIAPHKFLSQNPHFCKSALKRHSQWDFIALVAQAGIAYHEKTLGQLFCDGSASQIIDLLLARAATAGASVQLHTTPSDVVALSDGGFGLTLTHQGEARRVETQTLVVASGGLSIPKIGASDWGYRLARQFGHTLVPTAPALVPLTFDGAALDQARALAGVATHARVGLGKVSFDEGLLFTHRGLSGPSILQISSYWTPGDALSVDLAPGRALAEALISRRRDNPKRQVRRALAEAVPARLADSLCEALGLGERTLADTGNADLRRLGQAVHQWCVMPSGSEGYRTAEVTRGGVDTGALSSKTFESTHQRGLYFIGEVVDVTGWLGGYNFQWAWSSAWAAATAISARLRALS